MSLRSPGSILLISCYELGHQPLAAALPLGFLQRAGFAPAVLDIAVQPFNVSLTEKAQFIAISVPMHTALRLGVKVAERVRDINPQAIICFYGLYAALNSDYLLEHGADYCIGGEIETPLVALAEAIEREAQSAKRSTLDVPGVIRRGAPMRPFLERLPFALPVRESLPTLAMYAKLEHNGQSRVVGYVEASRGCLHLCTHCPIPPVYGGRFFIIPENIVLEDIRRQVAGGASHITFGDPDFLNGPGHALSVIRAMHAEFPKLTFDVTTKVEHILKRGSILPELGKLGCLFLISAVESVSPLVLEILEKNHTRADIEEAVKTVRAAGIAPRPTWVPFTPWTTLGDYLDMLAFIEELGLIDHVDPVQYTIRLLVPPGSYLLNRPEMKQHLGPLNQASFSYRWTHPDPRMDQLQKAVSALVEKDVNNGVDAGEIFYRVWSLAAGRRSGVTMPVLAPDRYRAPRLSEPWFC
ncbi:MAG: CUAEP/CCAEP-tail radical SAM protein [Gemmataceae bacterium]|nr:CUAEP/CCAEP-tail radical SAM protein [Gemmataceae bacterium]MCI0740817.1 CUAEP/CCAEP-tail radical SAM protein [Gemmataceae bacterium]